MIDVPRATGGRVLRVLMNGDLDEAVGLLAAPTPRRRGARRAGGRGRGAARTTTGAGGCAWPSASPPCSTPHRFGVKAAYVFGTTKNATAGPASDIDLLVHVERGRATAGASSRTGSRAGAWSLAEMNYLRTGYRTEGLLDVHYVTDADIAGGTNPFAAKIGAVTDAARALPLGGEPAPQDGR